MIFKAVFAPPLQGRADLRTDEAERNPDSEQMEHTATKLQMRHSVSVERIVGREWSCCATAQHVTRFSPTTKSQIQDRAGERVIMLFCVYKLIPCKSVPPVFIKLYLSAIFSTVCAVWNFIIPRCL